MAPPTKQARPVAALSRAALRDYFGSGWAFLVPYLLAYLMYFLLGWPVVPGAGGPAVPCLLHVFLGLHGLTLAAAALAMTGGKGGPGRGVRPSAAAAWGLLGLLFFLPGAYLEFPSDPWEHFARIQAWGHPGTGVTLYKGFGYFLPYSLVGAVHGARGFLGLDLYVTAISLLVCWQYCKLAKAAGLGERGAMVFAILQVVLFGNSAFGFYRYYGMASTMVSQLAAVALVRIGIEALSARRSGGGGAIARMALSAPLLVALMALDHVQGLGIAALGLAAAAVWRVLEWRRTAFWWLAGAAVALSFLAVHGLPREPALDAVYRPTGLMSPWYGFNVFLPWTRAGDRAMQILGAFGVFNLAAGVWLLRRNRLAGWLTVLPPIALCLPFVAIPLANSLAREGTGLTAVLTFHRMLLAVPAGLALVYCAREALFAPSAVAARTPRGALGRLVHPFTLVLAALLALTTVPAGGPWYNRFWNVLAKPAGDLTLRGVAADYAEYRSSPFFRPGDTYAVLAGIGFVLSAEGQDGVTCRGRVHYGDDGVPAANLERIGDLLDNGGDVPISVVVVPRPGSLTSAASLAAICSGHWLPQEAAMAFSGSREIGEAALAHGFVVAGTYPTSIYYRRPDASRQK